MATSKAELVADIAEPACMAHVQQQARKLLELELQFEIWKLPAQAKRLEAFEARYEAIKDRLLADFKPTVRPADSAPAETAPTEGQTPSPDEDPLF